MKLNKTWWKYIALLLAMVLAAGMTGGCQKTVSQNNTSDESVQNTVSEAFDTFLNEFFIDEVTSDSITLNYSIANYAAYGITDYSVGYGDLDLTNLDDTSELVNTLNELKSFDYNMLTGDQQLTYDILKSYLEINLEYSDMYLYEKILSPTIGLQSQLPVILSEYSFRTTQDIYDYIELVKQTDEYFDYIMEIVRMQSEAGLFMEDEIADKIIDQCSIFIEDAENNYLLEVFNDKVMAFDGISDEECLSLIEQNREAVLYNLIPAYEHIIDVLTELKGTGKYEGGLCNLPDGARYYEYLIKYGTGSNRTVDELDALLDTYINNALRQMGTVLSQNAGLYESIDEYTFCAEEPFDILADLQTRIAKDYPKLPDCDYDIKYVHSSLEEYMSPAFYFIPAIDEYDQNVIYINQKSVDEGQELYTTLAHEGFPGHLFQNVYFLATEPSPIRTLLSFSGYTEGWATYVELDSYTMGGIEESAGEVLSANTLIVLCVYGKIDIGVNAYGWNKTQVKDYLTSYFGTLDDETVSEIYDSMVAEPGNYLKYIIGCIEFKELRAECEEALGDAFNTIDFHTAILETGPCNFETLGKEVKKYLNITE